MTYQKVSAAVSSVFPIANPAIETPIPCPVDTGLQINIRGTTGGKPPLTGGEPPLKGGKPPLTGGKPPLTGGER